MITLPVVLTYKDISVFPDTENCNLYYCLRTTPHVRMSDDGNPIFRSTFWSGAKASDATVRGFMGGKINFDTNLIVTAEEENKIKDLIKERKISENRYKQLCDKNDKHINKDYPQPEEPTFGSVTYTSGTVNVIEENGGELVEWHNAGGKPALFGDNNSSTVMQLTPLGAAIFHKAITERSHAVSIAYDLKMEMAMPALDIRIYADSTQTASIARIVDKGCTGNVHSRKITETLIDNSCIRIDVNCTSTKIDEETVNQIRESMMSILDKKIEEIVKTKISPLTPEEREKDTKLIIEDAFSSFTEITFTESSVFEFSLCPQATICDFFETVTDEQMEKMVTIMDLSDEVFSFKEITLCATAPWNEKPFVNLIKVECEYQSLPEGHKDRVRSFTFDAEHPSAEWNFRKPKKDDGIIKYTPYVYLKGCSDCIKLPTQTAKGNYVIVNVGKIGLIDVAFHAHPNVVNLPGDLSVSGVQFEVWYDDANRNRLMGPEQIVISGNDLSKEVRFEKNLGVILDQPLRYKTTYFFKSIDPITLPEKTLNLSDDGVTAIYSDFPFKNRKTVQVELPLVPEDNVNDINGEIYYGKYTFPIDMNKDDDWEPVKVNLCSLDEKVKEYSYKFYLKYENKEYDMVTSAVMTGDYESSSLIVPIKRIEMAGIDLLGLGEKIYRANVLISLPEGCGKPFEIHLSRKDKDLESKSFYIFYPENVKFKIDWKLTAYGMNGKEMKPVSGTAENQFFIITPPEA